MTLAIRSMNDRGTRQERWGSIYATMTMMILPPKLTLLDARQEGIFMIKQFYLRPVVPRGRSGSSADPPTPCFLGCKDIRGWRHLLNSKRTLDFLHADLLNAFLLKDFAVSTFNISDTIRELCWIYGLINDGHPETRDVLANHIVRQHTGEEAEQPRESVYFPRATDVQADIDAFCEAGKQRPESDGKSKEGTPVESMAVMIYAMVFVQLIDVELALLDDVVVTYHDSSKRSHL